MGDWIPRNPVAQAVLATIITVGFFIAMFMPGIWPGFSLDEAMKQTLVTTFVFVVGYYFGSSSSSAKKDEVIATQSSAAATVATTAAAALGTGPGTGPESTIKLDDSTPIRTTEVPSK